MHKLLLGDSLEQLKTLPDNSVDACVTDPPYGLAFMGKRWDYDVPTKELWMAVYRVLKPGGHVLSFGGTRTYHRMVCAIEEAGFEIRDMVVWLYGSGFPKSHDISKAIDRAAGAEREVIGQSPNWRPAKTKGGAGFDKDVGEGSVEINITAPATDAAKRWQGWGTALKPANEPIVLARKPLEKGLTVAENVCKWGTGALNVDASRIAGEKRSPEFKNPKSELGYHGGSANANLVGWDKKQGRWPANVLFDEAAAAGLGDAARYFYCAKASKRERNAGLEGMPKKQVFGDEGGTYQGLSNSKNPDQNFHPTVKPIKLMEYLIKLVTPPNGTVLDPFMGSGTTGCAALHLGFEFIGIEREQEYMEIAKRRIEHWAKE